MIRKLSHATVHVLDPESARAFYTEKLGFEVRTDVQTGGFRWLTVGPPSQPELELVLMHIVPGPTLDAQGTAALRVLVRRGGLSGGVLQTDDCRRTCEELKARGVQFLQEPTEQPHAIEAVLRDDSGNFFILTQRR